MFEHQTRTISLLCPTCAGDQFEFDTELSEENRKYFCVGCQISFRHNDLKAANGGKIEAELSEFKAELASEIKASFKKAFIGTGWTVR